MALHVQNNYGSRLQDTLEQYNHNIERLMKQNGDLESQKGTIDLQVKVFKNLKPGQPGYATELTAFETFVETQVTEYIGLKKTHEIALNLLKTLQEVIAFCSQETLSLKTIQNLHQMKFDVEEICQTEAALSYSVADMEKKEMQVRQICEQFNARIPKVEAQLNSALSVLLTAKNGGTSLADWNPLGDSYLTTELKKRGANSSAAPAPSASVPAASYQKPIGKEPANIEDAIVMLKKPKGVVVKNSLSSSPVTVTSSVKTEEKAPPSKAAPKPSPRAANPNPLENTATTKKEG